MKRLFMIGLSLVMACSLAACSGSGDMPEPSSESSPELIVSENEGSQDVSEQEEEMETSEQVTVREDVAEGKTLIAYFSMIDIVPEGADASAHATPSIGNTESAAMEIQNQVGGDLFAIHTVQTYPVSHSECSAIAEEEMRSDARPELSTHVENMAAYDTIYIGYPIWWYIEPMAIRTFLEEYALSGKTIIPFCTTMGAGVEESVDNITSLVPDATVLEGLTLRTGREDFSEEISAWLAEIGMHE